MNPRSSSRRPFQEAPPVGPGGALIEILSPSLTSLHPDLVQRIDLLCRQLAKEIGWHYILDLVWILKQIELEPGRTILDAGAGNGVLQFLLADLGYNVISVDFFDRRIPLLASLAFPIVNMGGPEFHDEYIEHLQAFRPEQILLTSWETFLRRLFIKVARSGFHALSLPLYWFTRVIGARRPGRIYYLRADIRDLESIESESVDALASLSALEHMDLNAIPHTVREFKRVVRPGGKIIITTNAASESDWYHAPSKAWCFSERMIKELFALDASVPSNWSAYSQLLSKFRNSNELQRRMSPAYKLSGENGMPWGIWDPKYLPVGLLMIK